MSLLLTRCTEAFKDNVKSSFCFTGMKNTFGEFFNPGYDCSNVLNKRPDAKDGFFWLTLGSSNPKLVRFLTSCSKIWAVLNVSLLMKATCQILF